MRFPSLPTIFSDQGFQQMIMPAAIGAMACYSVSIFDPLHAGAFIGVTLAVAILFTNAIWNHYTIAESPENNNRRQFIQATVDLMTLGSAALVTQWPLVTVVALVGLRNLSIRVHDLMFYGWQVVRPKTA